MIDRLKELDSLRGIAALLVIAFHTLKRSDYFTKNAILHFVTGLSSVGWIGVDIFFTLSGFLITNILLQTRDHPHYFKNFYARRALRILPVYFLLIAVVVFFIPDLEKDFIAQMPKVLLTMLVFQQNWATLFFDFPISSYLVITWSLAIEEQFYLIWPLIVRHFSRKTLLIGGAAYVALTILVRAVGVTFFEDAGGTGIYSIFYFISFTRFEQLLIGAMLAVWLSYENMAEKIKKYSLPVFFVTLAAFAVLALASPLSSSPLFGYPPMTIIGYTLISLFTAALIAAFVAYPETSLLRRLFQNRALYFWGAYSYSTYLFHPIVTHIALNWLWRAKLRGAEIYALHAVVTFSVTMVIGLLTWHLIEKRALNLKKYFGY